MKFLVRMVMTLAALCVYVGFAILVNLVGVAPWLAFAMGGLLLPFLFEIHDGFCYFLLREEVDYEEEF